jgi:glycosyltransferase involved in cell wall biosynthesis
MKNLTLIIPAKNEEISLPKVLEEIKKYKCQKIIILSKKDKKTFDAISNFKCKIIKQKIDGYGAALIEGIENVKTKYLCIFNADGSFDPKYLNKMINYANKNYDFIFASRYAHSGGSTDDTPLTYIGNKIFTFLGNFLFKLKISDILFTYILGNTNKFKKLNLNSRDFRLCVEIPIKIKRNKFSYKCIPSVERSRIGGKKNVNEFIDGFLILYSMIKYFIKKQ